MEHALSAALWTNSRGIRLLSLWRTAHPLCCLFLFLLFSSLQAALPPPPRQMCSEGRGYDNSHSTRSISQMVSNRQTDADAAAAAAPLPAILLFFVLFFSPIFFSLPLPLCLSSSFRSLLHEESPGLVRVQALSDAAHQRGQLSGAHAGKEASAESGKTSSKTRKGEGGRSGRCQENGHQEGRQNWTTGIQGAWISTLRRTAAASALFFSVSFSFSFSSTYPIPCA